MSAKKFVQLLKESGLLEAATLKQIEQQVAQSKKTTPATIAGALVERGLLTKYQATKLVDQATAGTTPARNDRRAKDDRDSKATRRADDNDDLRIVEEDVEEEEEELTLAETEEDAKDKQEEEEEEEVVILEEARADEPGPVAGLTPVEDAGEALTPVGTSSQVIPAPVALEPVPALGGVDPFGQPNEGFGDPFTQPVRRPAATAKTRAKKKEAGKQRWDSKLMIGGITVFTLLCILGAVLAVNLLKAPPLEMFNAAEEAYRSESYPDALSKYERFLEKYPKDENSDEARVRVVLCKIRNVLNDPQQAHDTAKELLPTVLEEPAFREFARDELVTILPRIPEGFVKKANQASDTTGKEGLVKQAEQSMAELVNEAAYIPSSKRAPIESLVKRITEDIALVKRQIDQSRALAQAIGEIKQHVEAQNTVQAHEVYKTLLSVYPELGSNSELVGAVQEISQREQTLVKVVDEQLSAVTTEDQPAVEFRVVLASRSGQGVPRLQGQLVPLLAAGAVYGLDAGNGHVLWRRFVGHESQQQPVAMSSQPDSDILISDMRQNELLRVAGKTGALVWRLPIGEPFVAPVVAGDQIYVTTSSGKVLQVAAGAGASGRRVLTPQRLQAAAAVAQVHPYLLQPGEHSNVYAISTQTLACDEVLYLGHKAGTILVPPLIVQDHVFIAENKGDSACTLHVLKITPGQDGPLLSRPQAPFLLTGNVVVPMVLFGRRPLVVTDLGEISLFNVDFNAAKDSVSLATEKSPPARKEPMLGYPVVEGTTLFLADDKLAKYALQVTTKSIKQQSVTASQSAFIGPPKLFGDILIVARRLPGSTGAVVSALQVDNPLDSKAAWNTHLGVPVARADMAAGGKLQVISAAASLFEINRETLQSGYNDLPAFTAPVAGGNLSFTDQVEFADGKVAFFNPADQKTALLFNPAEGGKLQVVQLELAGANVTAIPVAFRDGLLTPADNGSVLLLHPATGANIVLPFQPQLSPGDTIAWRRPAVLGDEFVIADDRRNVYRVGIKQEPQPFLAEMARGKLDVNISSDLAAAGDTIYGVIRNTGGDVIVGLNAADLKVAKEFPLQGRVVWGPVQVGDAVLCLSDSDGLLCFQSGAQQRWITSSGCGGNPAGRPLRTESDYLFALIDGAVVRISGASGQQVARSEIGEPLGSGPVAYGNRLLLCGNDGALHVIPMPMPASGG